VATTLDDDVEPVVPLIAEPLVLLPVVALLDGLAVALLEPDIALLRWTLPCASLQCVAGETLPVALGLVEVLGEVEDWAAAVRTPPIRNTHAKTAGLIFIDVLLGCSSLRPTAMFRITIQFPATKVWNARRTGNAI
jgi:hypothetical protein